MGGLGAFLAAVLYVTRPASASGPSSNRVLNYQLRLTDANGLPLSGTKNVKISFYNDPSLSVPVTNLLHTDCGTPAAPVGRKIVFANGYGTVLIGDTAASGATNCANASAPNSLPSSLFSSATLYLGITVEADTEMTPRKRIVSQGYALNADLLDDLDTSAAGGAVAFVPVTDSSGNLTLTQNLTVDGSTLFVDAANNRVGVGVAAPTAQLTVNSSIVPQGSAFATTDSAIELSKTLTTTGTAIYLQSIWDFPAAGFGIGGLEMITQTKASNANNMTGGITSLTARAEHMGGGTATSMTGILATAGGRGGLAVTTATGVKGTALANSGSVVTIGIGVQGQNTATSGGITTSYAVYAKAPSSGASIITNNIGLAVDDITGSTNNTNVLIGTGTAPAGNFSIYNTSAYNNYFSGSVGVGTTSPAAFKLQVAGSIGPNADDASDLGSAALRWRDLYLGPTSLHLVSTAGETTTGRDWKLSIQETDGASEGNLRFLEGATEIMNVTPAGNVGIGTTAPAQLLDMAFGHFAFRSVPEPTAAPTVALAGAGAGNVDNGAHSYAVTFVTAAGETALGPSAPVTVVDKTVNGQVSLTGIPVSSNPKVTARKIYRTKVITAGYFLVTTINDNTTTTYTDNASDASLTVGPIVATGSGEKNNTTAGTFYMDGAQFLQAGDSNTAFGMNTLASVIGGRLNVGFGLAALANNTYGSQNVAVGASALSANSFGGSNVAVGNLALLQNTTGSHNVGVGADTLFNTTTGTDNIGIGSRGLYANTTGQENIAIGGSAGDSITTGAGNLFLGVNADATANNFSRAVAIGNNAVVGCSNCMALGGTGSFGVNVGIGTASPITQLHVPGKVPTAALATVATGSNPWPLYVQGRYAYVLNNGIASETLQIFDVSNPAAPVSLATIGTGGGPSSLSVQGRYAYVGNENGQSFQIFDISNPTAPSLVSTLSLTGSRPRGLYAQGKYVYLASQTSDTLKVIDVSNPAAPVEVGSAAAGAVPNRIYVQDRYAYVVHTTANTLQIFDVSNPAAPVSVSSTGVGGSAWSIFVRGKHAFVGKSGGTMQIFDVSNPASPTSVGSVTVGAGNVQDIYVQGNIAYVAGSALAFIDVSNPAAPVSLGTVATGATPIGLRVQGRYAYLVNNGSNTLQVFDVGGSYLQQLEVGGIETGTLALRNNLSAVDAAFSGGVAIGRSLNVAGGISTGSGISLGGNILPSVDNTYDLGSTSLRWKTLHVGPGSVVVHNDATDTAKATLGFSGAQAKLNTNAGTNLRVSVGATPGMFFDATGQMTLSSSASAGTLFVQGTSSLAALGGDLVTNGAFAADTDWTKGANWTISAGVANHTAGDNNLSQTLALTPNQSYQIVYTATTTTAGSLVVQLGNASSFAVGQSTGAIINTIILTPTSGTDIVFDPDAAWAGTIDNVTVKPITPAGTTMALNSSDGTPTSEFRSGGPGTDNTFIGKDAGRYVISTGNLTAFGSGALTSGGGNSNTAVGTWALHYNTTGDTNTAFGTFALEKNTVGSQNTAVGHLALDNNISGSANVAIGRFSLLANRSGASNTALGVNAGDTNTTGSNNLFVGYGSDASASNLATASAIGYNATVGCSNCMVLGGIGADAVNVGINTSTPATRLDVSGLAVSTDADGTVGALRSTASFTKNDANARTFSVTKIQPTYNFGGSNANTTVNAFEIDSTNTSVTGLTANLIKASYGGAERLRVGSAGDILATGAFGTGTLTASGAGERLIWYPGKAAFRAGRVTGSQWNDANIGNHSFAVNLDTTASGHASFASGSVSTASGDVSTAMGASTVASGTRAVAIGESATASGIQSMALGAFLTAGPVQNTLVLGRGVDSTNRLVNNIRGSLMYGHLDTTPTLYVRGGEPYSPQGTVSNSAGGTAVTGSITFFTQEIVPGDSITVGAETRTVSTVTNDSTIAVSQPFVNANSGVAYTVKPALLKLQDSAAAGKFVVDAAGNVGIGTVTPNSQLHVDGGAGNVELRLTGQGSGTSTADGSYVSLSGAGSPNNQNLQIVQNENRSIEFHTNAAGGPNERMRIDAAGNVGIGASTPGAKLDVAAGTLTPSVIALQVKGTLPSSAGQDGVNVEITSAGATGIQRAFLGQLMPGYTGGSRTVAFEVANSAAGTGTDIYNLNANFGFAGSAVASTTGSNAGAFANAEGGDINVGFFGRATFSKNNATNVGVMGLARNTGTTPTEVGGFFGLYGSNPSFTSAALIADNASEAAPIFLARDNGTSMFSIADGGTVNVLGTAGNTFVVDTTTLVADATNNRVGIGTAAPTYQLHVKNAIASTGSPADFGFVLEDSQGSPRRGGFGFGGGDDFVVGSLTDKTLNIAQNNGAGSCLTFDVGGGLHFSQGAPNCAIGSNTRFLIDTSGNFGLGDTTPDSLLDLLSSAAANTTLKIANTNAGDLDPVIGFELAEGTHSFTMGVDDSDADKFKIGTTAIDANTRLTIDSSGNVGIGTTGPSTLLHVVATNSFTDGVSIARTGFSTVGRFVISNNGTNDTLTLAWGGTAVDGFDFDTGGDLFIRDGNLQLSFENTATTNGVCHSGANSDTTASDRYLVVCSGAPGDIAEWYETDGAQPGDIVVPTDRTLAYESEKVNALTGEILPEKETLEAAVFSRSSLPYQHGLFGVVSSSPVQTIGKAIIEAAEHPQPIALAGRVKVRVVTENGPIAPGDPITSSSTPGAGMKATGPGMIVGFALSGFDGDGEGSILLFINPGWWDGSDVLEGNSTSGVATLAELTVDQDIDLQGYGLLNVRVIMGYGDLWSIDEFGRITIKEVVADSIRVRQSDEKATIDSSVIPAGEDYVQVHNPAIHPDSRVFVTFKKNPKSLWWVDEIMDGLFILKTEQPVVEDVSFDYWLIEVSDERTPPPPEAAPEPVPGELVDPESVPVVEEPPTDDPAPVEEPAPEAAPEPTPETSQEQGSTPAAEAVVEQGSEAPSPAPAPSE